MLTDQLIDLMPEPSVSAPDLTETSTEPNDNASAITQNDTSPTDIDGTAFDADLHATDPNGSPKLTKTGRFAKKRGRKSTLNAPNQPRPDTTLHEQAEPQTDYMAMGKMLGGMFFGAAMTLGGGDFAPNATEEQLIGKAFGDYCAAKEVDDLPPSMALIGAMAMYVLPRLRMPNTKKRMGGIKAKIAHWYIERKTAKANRKFEAALRAEQEQQEQAG